MKTPTLSILLAALALSFGSASASTDWPATCKTIQIIVPAPGGVGTADAIGRLLATQLAKRLEVSFIVDNKGGANGNIGAAAAASATPNGCRLLFSWAGTLAVNPSLYKLRWSVEKHFAPVALLATAQYILVVHPSVKAGTVQELIALAKQKPKSLNYASAGVGSPLHLAAELFKKRAGVDMVHLPYKGGGPAAAAVLAGEAQVIFGSVASSMPHVKAGKLKALATTGARRSKVAPELRTLAESGFAGLEVTSWYAFLVPAKTPGAIVGRLHDAALKAVALPDVQQAMSRQGLESEAGTAQQLAERIRAETAMWAEVVRSAGIKAE